MNHIRCSMSIMNQQRQVRRLSQICNPPSLFDRSPRELRLHELCVRSFLVMLLLVLRFGEGGSRRAIGASGIHTVALASRGRVDSRGSFVDRFTAVTSPLASFKIDRRTAYLSESFAFPAVVFFRFGAGILHSIEKATQFVHGTPKLAASHRTCSRQHLTFHDAHQLRRPATGRNKTRGIVRTFLAWQVCTRHSD